MTGHLPHAGGELVRSEDVLLAADDRNIPVRIFRAPQPRRGWLVWAHGGSWTGGSVRGWHTACSDLTYLGGCTLVSVEYRLAPEHRHPAALRDVLAVLDSVREEMINLADEPVAVGGDSAGGTLAACAALARRGRPLAAQVLAYPPLDPDCRSASYDQLDGLFPSRGAMRAAWRTYLGCGPATMAGGPLDADDLAGAAPAIIGVGDLDPVSDEARRYADRLRSSGTRVMLRVFPGMTHGAFLAPDDHAGTGNPLRRWLGRRTRELFRTEGL